MVVLHKELSCSWCKAVCRGQVRWGRENGKALWGCREAMRPRMSCRRTVRLVVWAGLGTW